MDELTKKRLDKLYADEGRWILRDKKPVQVGLGTWAEWFENHNNRIIARDQIGEVVVSTAFIGIYHSFMGGPPLLFETMIFGGEHDGYQDRYTTWDEAVEGHKKALAVANGEADDQP